MAKNIGLAGIEYYYVEQSYNNCLIPRGRVAAFTKSFHASDLTNRYIKRLVKNACLWTAVNKIDRVAYFDTENETFNSNLSDVLSDIFGSVVKLSPWYSLQDFNLFNAGCYILFPNYNPQKGNFMPDSVQSALIDQVLDIRAGLVLGEWFHFLQSLDIPTKRSFSFHGDGTIPSQEEDPEKGLFTISPFNIPTFANLSKPANSSFSKKETSFSPYYPSQDDMGISLPNQFNLRNTVNSTGGPIYKTAGYNALYIDLQDVKPELTAQESEFIYETDKVAYKTYIYYYVDSEEQLATTTTTTTTAAPVSPDIKFEVATISENSSCGPYKLSLAGQHANLFSLENGKLYLLKDPTQADQYNVRIKYEDFFTPKRFKDLYKDFTINLRECNAPLSKPIDGSREIWRYRPDAAATVWDLGVGAVTPDSDHYSFTGEGTVENPLSVELGGSHFDNYVMWIQVNEPGTLSWKIESNTEGNPDGSLNSSLLDVYCQNQDVTLRSNSDWANLYLASGIGLTPRQHSGTISNLSYGDGITLKNVAGTDIGIAGLTRLQNQKDSEYLISFNPELNNNVFLLFAYSKDKTISVGDDRVKATLLIGTTPAPPPVIEEFTIFYINRIDNSSISVESPIILKAVGGAEVSDGLNESINYTNELDIRVSTTSGYRFASSVFFTIVPSNTPISISVTEEENTFVIAKVQPFTMPLLGGSATVYIDAETEPVPTTTLPPRVTYTLAFKNYANETRFSLNNLVIDPDQTEKVFKYNITAREGEGGTYNISDCNHLLYLDYGSTISSKTYYPNINLPIVSITDETFLPNSFDPDHRTCPDEKIVQLGQEEACECSGSSCQDFEILEEIRVTHGYSCFQSNNPNRIRIDIPNLPEGGGTVYLRLDGFAVSKTTTTVPPTTPTPTTLPPCDDLILVFCSQELSCEPDGENCSPNLSTSSNSITFDTCCPELSTDDIIRIVYETRIGSSDGLTTDVMLAGIENYYRNSCPEIPTEAFSECRQQLDNGSCGDINNIRTIDSFPCPSEYNPLP